MCARVMHCIKYGGVSYVEHGLVDSMSPGENE